MIVHWDGTTAKRDHKDVITEEPLSIRIQGRPYAVIMRTPGDEIAHAAGFCLTEGIVDEPADFRAVASCEGAETNVVTVTLTAARREKIGPILERRGFISQTSCGICGKEIVAELQQNLPPVPNGPILSSLKLFKCIETLSAHQPLRRRTRASHAAALFDVNLNLLAAAEDVGRHNALDKVIGNLFLSGTLAEANVSVLSSRTSYELVQKAARAAIPIVLSVSRPTAIAVALATRLNMTLACLAPRDGLYIFCGTDRIQL
ncbi:MAG: formate dehydrogenase accessory sulfurtransferase FdhD [Desulfobacterales bacterium]